VPFPICSRAPASLSRALPDSWLHAGVAEVMLLPAYE